MPTHRGGRAARMEVAVVADEVLGADGGIGIHRVRAEVLDGEGHVRAVRVDDSAAESAEGFRRVVHAETVPVRSDSVAVARAVYSVSSANR